MEEVLAGHDTTGKFKHLSDEDRLAIREILMTTIKDCPLAPASTATISSNTSP
jgi:hypothetical protein